MSNLFFNSSRSAYNNVTETFDFVWPTSAAMWNLRWQVNGFLIANPEASEDELNARFAGKMGKNHPLNLRKNCVEIEWDEQQKQFARFLLIQLCAIYEGYISALLREIKSSEDVMQFQRLQTVTKKKINKGIREVIATLTMTESHFLKDAFYPTLKSHKMYSERNLDDLIRVYRYFKECRNCIIHSGGHPQQWAIDASNAISGITAEALGVKEMPLYTPITLNQPVVIHLRGIVGFASILLRLIITIDAELSKSKLAEHAFETMWNENNLSSELFSSNETKRRRRLASAIHHMGLPKIKSVQGIETYLIKQKLINLNKNH